MRVIVCYLFFLIFSLFLFLSKPYIDTAMKNAIPSGTSLFDVLTMIIPGGLIILLISILNFTCCFKTNDFGVNSLEACLEKVSGMMIFWYFVLSYLVGLVWNMMMDTLFSGFRNDTYSIQEAKDKQENKGENGDFPTRLCRNVVDTVRMFCRIVVDWALPKCCSEKMLIQDIGLLKKYYKVYYSVATCSIGDVIIILETQVAFIRNMLLVVLGYALFFILCSEKAGNVATILSIPNEHMEVWGWGLLTLCFFMFFVMISRQQKIYFRIWEEFEYRNK